MCQLSTLLEGASETETRSGWEIQGDRNCQTGNCHHDLKPRHNCLWTRTVEITKEFLSFKEKTRIFGLWKWGPTGTELIIQKGQSNLQGKM